MSVLRLDIERFARSGEGIARVRGVSYAVVASVPGDLIEAIPTGEDRPGRSGFRRARILRIRRPSPDRVVPECPRFGECGGCDWLHVDAGAALRHKVAAVRETSALADDAAVEAITPAPRRWRRVARLAVGRGPAGAPVLGFRAARGRRVVAIGDCPAIEEEIVRAVAAIGKRRDILAARYPRGAGEMWVLCDADRRAWLATGGERLGRGRRWDPIDPAVLPEHLRPLRAVPEIDAIGGARVEAPCGGFVQAGREAAGVLGRLVARMASSGPAATVLELYAGSGFLTSALAPVAGRLVAVESDREAAAALGRNARRWAASHVEVVRADAAAYAASPAASRPPPDLVVADPPRTGLGPAAKAIGALRPPRILLVGCDLPALGRDLRALRGAGYAIRGAAAVDMFPGTHHVEAVVLLDPGTGCC